MTSMGHGALGYYLVAGTSTISILLNYATVYIIWKKFWLRYTLAFHEERGENRIVMRQKQGGRNPKRIVQSSEKPKHRAAQCTWANL
ncbi:hypothetical protein JTE90_025053 [Oedothorax gibbosus]|uniref:Uncharacterized protein n=1 Tax=Oedothorax gibbosus TaxID=931172 RepID=A0AAV6TTG1_9ARAC|nr:hypothetical protein JTE90_025053 [Oedothorax gibbosus]